MRGGGEVLPEKGAGVTSVNPLLSLVGQVIHNWTIPLHGERSDQILLTRTFEMLSRCSERRCVECRMFTASVCQMASLTAAAQRFH